ncbi:MAG: ATP-dependent Clp protease adaptor ClpS [Gammaproteobacteria bacterium RIFCSPHIGHO2_12_FULL_37_14]|nr:MAG: ATP-dependent Clp protease adaptor ClpS [Gammaproteobacteria bacterium RIFCSPHIGHO2_12_FULL_37_14]
MKNEVNKEYANNLDESLKTEQPLFYRVIMHNDDFTPMEFVVRILERFFFMDRDKAVEMMMEVHTAGSTVCGIFSKDIAESKIADVTDYSRMHEHPLMCSLESE